MFQKELSSTPSYLFCKQTEKRANKLATYFRLSHRKLCNSVTLLNTYRV